MHDRRNILSVKKIGRLLFLVLLILFFFLAGGASVSAQQDDPAAKSETKQPGQITGIIISGTQTNGMMEASRVLVTANRELAYTSIKQHEPLEVIFYFKDTTLGNIQPLYTPESDIIASIKTAEAPDHKGGTSIEVLLKKDCTYEVNRTGTDLEISFLPSEAGAPVEGVEKPVTARAESPEALPESAVEAKAPKPFEKPEVPPKPAVIDRIDFTSRESGKSSILIGTTLPVKYQIDKVADRTLKVRLFNSRLPEYRRHRPLITTRFESAVDRISPFQAKDMKDTTDIVIELREWVPYRAVQEDNLLTVYFDPSAIGPRPFEAANLPSWQQVLEGTEYTAQKMLQEEGTPEGAQSYAELLGEKKHYTGQKIALDFYQTNIKNVFRILQQVSGKNYAVDKDVTGEVTISLEKPVPWDQVLDLILQMNQLGMVEQGNIIRIATRRTLQAEENARRAKLEAIQKRKEQAKKLEPLETEYILINYANAGAEILPHLNQIITKGRGNITVDGRNNQLIITDTRPKIEKCKEIIKNIDKVTPQVLIEARIVEVSEDFKRELGTSWGLSSEDVYRSDLNGQYSYNVAMNAPTITQPEVGAGTLGFNFTRLDAWGTPFVLDAALQAMETEGSGKIISSPKILTLDNKAAKIKQGLRVPYRSINTEGGSPTTEFEDVDLLLDVTPHVTPDHRVALTVKTTKNEILGYDPVTGDPITSVNEANTDLLVDDGETIVIGGVVKSSMTLRESGFPVLKDVPMLGWLFKTKQNENEKKELLIFITPRIVQLEQKSLVQVKE